MTAFLVMSIFAFPSGVLRSHGSGGTTAERLRAHHFPSCEWAIPNQEFKSYFGLGPDLSQTMTCHNTRSARDFNFNTDCYFKVSTRIDSIEVVQPRIRTKIMTTMASHTSNYNSPNSELAHHQLVSRQPSTGSLQQFISCYTQGPN